MGGIHSINELILSKWGSGINLLKCIKESVPHGFNFDLLSNTYTVVNIKSHFYIPLKGISMFNGLQVLLYNINLRKIHVLE